MSKIRVREQHKCKIMTSRDFMLQTFGDEAGLAGFPENILNIKMRIHEEGSETSPQLFEAQIPPNTVGPLHSHEEDEIMYIIEGEMILGNRSLFPGTSLFIAGNTLYSFKSGPKGLKFLNFRPHKSNATAF